MTADIANIINLERHPVLDDQAYRTHCREQLDVTGSLLLHGFIVDEALAAMKQEAMEQSHLAYYCEQRHTAYLWAQNGNHPSRHAHNRQVSSSKGCITDDQIPDGSPLRALYQDRSFQGFLCEVLGEESLHPYADPQSSINYHYYRPGQELGWHFDNSSFAVTLMIQAPESGGVFEYISALRDSSCGDMNYAGVTDALDGALESITLDIRAGTLALFRGRDSLHRVTPVEGSTLRIQVVLAYNTEPGIALSEQARRTFYGRVI